MKKVVTLLIVILFLVAAFNFTPVEAFGGGFNPSNIKNQAPNNSSKIQAPIQKISNSILLLLQIASVSGILIMGIKYMYSSPDQKAILKKGAISVIIGLILVFAASTIAQFVITSFNQAIS